ncbi:MAG: hypothetical protein RMY64_05790 [Nostoc sp. DedQUE08]|uniref:hypothetical protein n=1 Tax=unclassified Nostoc TaxID=2593658 RepID=UPI002AD2EABC|nr:MULTISPECIES: hypothetical protein [unclassified Nostoc]MDZ8035406.1 hypothetical protein [Nostoc sp. DedSLP04]MDZ8065142.1 hypothetical protein [Nostoc sp. DedQUE08]MDZ8091029.1 hypothetical protein [Nostoc sp. DedQUE05]MDZ8129764.1 hypothetical protein [Nostoc sp. DedQUE07]
MLKHISRIVAVFILTVGSAFTSVAALLASVPNVDMSLTATGQRGCIGIALSAAFWMILYRTHLISQKRRQAFICLTEQYRNQMNFLIHYE